jgi:hypothetical protein
LSISIFKLLARLDFPVGSRVWSAIFVSPFFLFMSVNFVVDPYQQYRKAELYDIYFEQQNGRYLNAGIAKNYDYKSVLLGTSHAANFRISELQEKILFKQPVKLIVPGASAYEEHMTLQTVFESREDVEAVLYGIDSSAFQVDAAGFRRDPAGFPTYLYEDGINNRLRYLIGFGTFLEGIASIRRSVQNQGDILFSHDRMYEWQHQKEKDFGSARVLAAWNRQIKKLKAEPMHHMASFDVNILPHLKAHPDVRFIIFHPPYSVLKYKLMQASGIFQDYLEFKKHVYEVTRGLDNVSLYDFQAAQEITSNLENYKDLTHYHQRINSWMLEQIAAGRYRVNEDSVERYHSGLLEQVEVYNPSLVSPVTASSMETPSSSPARR